MCERRVDLLVCSLPLHRHSYIGFILAFPSSIHNKHITKITSNIDRMCIRHHTHCSPHGSSRLVSRSEDSSLLSEALELLDCSFEKICGNISVGKGGYETTYFATRAARYAVHIDYRDRRTSISASARRMIREKSHCTILPLDSRNKESAQIPCFWNPMVKWCNGIFL